MNRRQFVAGTLAVFLVALTARLGPLYWSPLPFNPDGIGYAGRAEAVLALERLPLETMATDSVGFTALLSTVSAVTGANPFLVAQPTSALVGAGSCLVGVALVARFVAGHRREVPARPAALLAGLLLAVEGIYLYRSMPTDEQTAGLLLVPLVALAVHRALATGDRGWAVVAALLYSVLPPLHNLTGLVAATVVTVVLLVALLERPTVRAAGWTIGIAILVWGYTVGYHAVTAATTSLVIVQADRLARAPGLFVAWVVLVLAGVAWYLTTSRRLRRGVALVVLCGPFVLLALNAVRAVYPGTPTTPRTMLLLFLPLVVPLLFAAWISPAVTDQEARPFVALVAAPLVFVGFGLTAALTFEYIGTVWRSQLFAHVPVLGLAAAGTVAVLARADRHDGIGAVVVTVVVACALVSAPVAFSGLELLSYKGVTTEAEFAAVETAATDVPGPVATDNHLSRISGHHGPGVTQTGTFSWLADGAPPPQCPVLAQRSWTTTGAQFHPHPPVRLAGERYRSLLERRNVVYAVATDDPIQLAVARPGATGCP